MELKDGIFVLVSIILLIAVGVAGAIAISASNEVGNMKAEMERISDSNECLLNEQQTLKESVDTNEEAIEAHQEQIDIMIELWGTQIEYNEINAEMWEIQLVLNEYI